MNKSIRSSSCLDTSETDEHEFTIRVPPKQHSPIKKPKHEYHGQVKAVKHTSLSISHNHTSANNSITIDKTLVKPHQYKRKSQSLYSKRVFSASNKASSKPSTSKFSMIKQQLLQINENLDFLTKSLYFQQLEIIELYEK